MTVRWSSFESDSSSVQNGVRQGRNLSPMLFSVYIDDLLRKVQGSKRGCHVGRSALNIIAYADDLVLLSPTRDGIQKLVHLCESFAHERDTVFNVKKTVCMFFHPQRPYSSKHLNLSNRPSILLNDHRLDWVDNLTLALAGGVDATPLRFFEDSVKTAARSAAKFGMAYEETFLHMT